LHSKKRKKIENEEKNKANDIKFGMTSIPLRYMLLGITLWCMCY